MNADPTESHSMDRWLSTAEVANLLDISPGYVRRLARNGALMGERREDDGRETWNFDPAVVESFASTRPRVARSRADSIPADPNGIEWASDLLLAENADLQRQLLAERLHHAERRMAALEADNAALQSELQRWKSLVHSLSAPQDDQR